MKIKTNIKECIRKIIIITTIRPTNFTYVMVVTFKFAKTLHCDVKLLSNAVLLGNDEIYGELPPNDTILPFLFPTVVYRREKRSMTVGKTVKV